MRFSFALRLNLAVLAACAVLTAQVAPPRVIGPPDRPEVQAPPVVQPQRQGQPAQQPAQPGAQPGAPGAPPATQQQGASAR